MKLETLQRTSPALRPIQSSASIPHLSLRLPLSTSFHNPASSSISWSPSRGANTYNEHRACPASGELERSFDGRFLPLTSYWYFPTRTRYCITIAFITCNFTAHAWYRDGDKQKVVTTCDWRVHPGCWMTRSERRGLMTRRIVSGFLVLVLGPLQTHL
jgi:hypothetical protein